MFLVLVHGPTDLHSTCYSPKTVEKSPENGVGGDKSHNPGENQKEPGEE
jgi:hypothetical protein